MSLYVDTIIKKVAVLTLAFCIMAASASASDIKAICSQQSLEELTPGESASDWYACAAAEAGAEVNFQDYLLGLEAYVCEKYASQGGLDKNKATEWHRIALTVKALGKDPTSFGGVNLIKDGITEPIVDLSKQGINGLIWAAITAQECGAVFDKDITLRQICENIVSRQNDDGGFSLRGASDPDITAMAIRALWNAEGFRSYGELARAALISMKSESGGYASYGVENCESSAQAKQAFCYIGDVENASKINLEIYRTADGYAHVSGADTNRLATAQAVLAEAAYNRLVQSQTEPVSQVKAEDKSLTDVPEALVTLPEASGTEDEAAASEESIETAEIEDEPVLENEPAEEESSEEEAAEPLPEEEKESPVVTVLSLMGAVALAAAVYILSKKRKTQIR